jgi:hypothetical protein
MNSMMKPIFEECIEIVKTLVGHDYLYFDHAVEIRTTPHSMPFNAWAVCVSPQNKLFVMDNEEQWHEVELSDVNAVPVVGSLYQRLNV